MWVVELASPEGIGINRGVLVFVLKFGAFWPFWDGAHYQPALANKLIAYEVRTLIILHRGNEFIPLSSCLTKLVS